MASSALSSLFLGRLQASAARTCDGYTHHCSCPKTTQTICKRVTKVPVAFVTFVGLRRLRIEFVAPVMLECGHLRGSVFFCEKEYYIS